MNMNLNIKTNLQIGFKITNMTFSPFSTRLLNRLGKKMGSAKNFILAGRRKSDSKISTLHTFCICWSPFQLLIFLIESIATNLQLAN